MIANTRRYGTTHRRPSAGTPTIDTAREVVDLTDGDDRGGFGAVTGLVLAQDL